MAKVLYKQGTKDVYLGLSDRQDNALYFCTDTRELFKGDKLYTDGLRLVSNFAALPSYKEAAESVLYVCRDTGNGFVLNGTKDNWILVIHGVDGESIGVNKAGQIEVKKVAIDKVDGLTARLEVVEQTVVSGAPMATHDISGLVKPSSEFSVESDGGLSLTAVEISKITGLEERLRNIEAASSMGITYKGEVENREALPTKANIGDMYKLLDTGERYFFNGEVWAPYNTTGGLSPISKESVNQEQFEFIGNILNIKSLEAELVKYGGKTLSEALEEMYGAIQWENMASV